MRRLGTVLHSVEAQLNIIANAGEARAAFRRQPVVYFDRHVPQVDDTFWLPTGDLFVVEPDAAKSVLADPEGRFGALSGFFHVRHQPALGTRALQDMLGQACGALFSRRLIVAEGRLEEIVDRQLGASSAWPRAGNRLAHHVASRVLVAPEAADRVAAVTSEIVTRGLGSCGSAERGPVPLVTLMRWLSREGMFPLLEAEVERRAAVADRPVRDLFDVLAVPCRAGARAADLAELYIPIALTLVGSVGLTLGWSLHLLGTRPTTRPPTAVPASWVVREALRLWPVAWQLSRRPNAREAIGDSVVTPDQEVFVSPFVTQRQSRYWPEPNAFRPERWADADDGAFFPFGWGAQAAAIDVTVDLASSLLEIILRTGTPRLVPSTTKATKEQVSGWMAPPPFRLDRAA